MSRRKKRSREGYGPAASAGLLSFWGEKTSSVVKVRPELVIIMVFALIVTVLMANLFL
ncbi:MAG: preprotein translocase subunit Sec61beta [Candidatus Bathyarchaeia archaeon]